MSVYTAPYVLCAVFADITIRWNDSQVDGDSLLCLPVNPGPVLTFVVYTE